MVVQEVLQLLLFFNQMLEFGLSMGMQSCFSAKGETLDH
jgi:hypothetical protein